MAWAPIYPRDMAPAERALAISSLLERCSKDPKSKLGEVLSDSPVGKDILNGVRAQLDKLKEEVEFKAALDKQWALVKEGEEHFCDALAVCKSMSAREPSKAEAVIEAEDVNRPFCDLLEGFVLGFCPEAVVAEDDGAVVREAAKEASAGEKALHVKVAVKLAEAKNVHQLHQECVKYVPLHKEFAECVKAMLKVDEAVFEGDSAEQLSPSDAADVLHDLKCLGGADNELVKNISSIPVR